MVRGVANVSGVLVNIAGKFHARVVLIFFPVELPDQVTENRVTNPRLGTFDHVLIVDRAGNLVLPKRCKCDVRNLSSPGSRGLSYRSIIQSHHHGNGRCIFRFHGGFDETDRREDDLDLTLLSISQCRSHVVIVRIDVPGVLAAAHGYRLLVALKRLESSTARWIIPLLACHFFSGVHGGKIDGSRVRGHVDARPIVVDAETLTEDPCGSGPGILDGLQIIYAHRGCGSLQDRLDVLGRHCLWSGRADHQSQYSNDNQYSGFHTSSCFNFLDAFERKSLSHVGRREHGQANEQVVCLNDVVACHS